MDKNIHLASVKFVEYLTTKWPQFMDGELLYYVSGSLAPKLLSQSKATVEEYTLNENDETVYTRNIHIPEKARRILEKFNEPMGDFDFVSTRLGQQDPGRIKKGGGGPSFDELPREAIDALKINPGQVKLMCDPVKCYGEKKFYIVEIGGRKYAISSLDHMLAYKTLHILEKGQITSDDKKYIEHFERYYLAAKEIPEYSYNHLITTVYNVMSTNNDLLNKIRKEPISLEDKINNAISVNNYPDIFKSFIQSINTKPKQVKELSQSVTIGHVVQDKIKDNELKDLNFRIK